MSRRVPFHAAYTHDPSDRRRALRKVYTAAKMLATKHCFPLLLAAAALPAAPPGWTEHRDPKGFSVQHPAGWVVEIPEKDMVVVHDPTGGIQAIAYGFMTKPDVTAKQWLEGIPTRFPARFQKVALDAVSQNRPTQAIAGMRFTSRWGDGRARVLCSLNRGAGMMFAIVTPAFRFDEFARDLVTILQSFTVTQPQGGAPQQQGQQQRPPDALAGIDWARWSDPVENAISLEYPRGWRMEVGTVRRGAVDVHQWVRTTSSDGIMIFSGDRDQTSYVLPTQTLAMSGFREGSRYSPGYGTQMIVMRYIPGVAFAEQWARQHMGATQIRERKSRDDLAAQANAANRNVGAGVVQNQTTIGEVSFSTANGSAGYVIAGTQVTGSADLGGMWFVTTLLGYVAPPQRVPTATAVTGHMLTTFQVNPQWAQGQQQTTMQTSRIVSDTANYVARLQSDSYWNRQATQDRSNQNYSDMQRGIQIVVDPNTGQKYEAVSGHNYYYLTPGGTTVASDTELPPNVDVTVLNLGSR